MNLSEVSAEVIRITKRPDKSIETIVAINKAISYCVLKGDFAKDLVEASLPIDPLLYGDTISIASLTRFRRFTYIKPTGKRYYLTPMPGDKIFIPKDQMQPNAYYIAGTSLTYTLSELNTALEVSYLTYAPTLDTTVLPTHWLLDMNPYAIIDLAAAFIFAGIGDTESANRHQALGYESFLTLRRDLALGD